MAGFTITASGDFGKTEAFLKRMMLGPAIFDPLSRFAQMGISALAAATPVESGETANSWTCEVVQDGTSWSLIWGNTHINEGVPIAVILQHGHGTGTGGFVEGTDYINPALAPIFEQMATEGWKVVTSA